MGDYAVLLFAGLLGCDAALAFAPQALLDPRLPHTSRSQENYRWFDLARPEFAAGLARTQTWFVYGSDDIWNTARMPEDLPGRRLALMYQDHLAMKSMVQWGDLTGLLQHLCDGTPLMLSASLDDVAGIQTSLLISGGLSGPSGSARIKRGRAQSPSVSRSVIRLGDAAGCARCSCSAHG